MNRNYDPYKKTILFFLSLISILLMSALFAWFWYNIYAETMYAYRFYRRGNYAIIALYAILQYFFAQTYGALRIGQLRRIEVVLSQFLSNFIANFVMYIIISLLAFRPVNPAGMLVMQLMDFVIATLWTMFATILYNRIFQPWKILLIYGERPAADLIYKVEARRDKYAIYDAIDVNEGLEAIGERMEDFQAVIIGDIAVDKRNELLKYCFGKKKRAYVIPKISDILLMGADQIHIFDTPFSLVKGYAMSFDEKLRKRFLDLAFCIPLILITSPLMLLIALAIKLYDRGPVFYRQVRLTKNDREFQIIKFRSMVVDAEDDGEAVLAQENDPRVTPVGRFIRATRMDELPQLFNILKGDMSFVGPRPERPEIAREYTEEMPEFAFRTRVKAGLTGFAQIYGKYNTVPYDKLKLDLFYIENFTLWLDVKLILMTIKTILKKDASEGIAEEQQTALRESAASNEEIESIVHEIKNRGNHE